MTTKYKTLALVLFMFSFTQWSCKTDGVVLQNENKTLPSTYGYASDTLNAADMNWRTYFGDANLIALIDTALRNNQELNILWQEMEISKNEIRARKGEYLPFVGATAGAGIDKPGEYTRAGAVEEQLEVKPGKPFPKPMHDYTAALTASWEIDIWRKLRNAKKSAAVRYLSTTEGKNFMATKLIAEIASSYYELMALDNYLDIIERNIAVQSDALKVVRQQKESARLTQLAVNRFEAQLLHTQNLQYAVKQQITETENRINYLTGRLPHPIKRDASGMLSAALDTIHTGIPSHLLLNRPDVRQAELDMASARLDVKVARARFYPSVGISAGIGLQAFNPSYLISPASLAYQFGGDLVAPLVNRNAIKAAYRTAGAKQIQSVYRYQQVLLSAYVDVVNQLAKMDNYSKSYATKKREVDILMQSVTIAGNLFTSARADYAEVLLTQREALEARMDIIEIRLRQMEAKVNVYRALGGGWK